MIYKTVFLEQLFFWNNFRPRTIEIRRPAFPISTIGGTPIAVPATGLHTPVIFSPIDTPGRNENAKSVIQTLSRLAGIRLPVCLNDTVCDFRGMCVYTI